MDQDGGGVRVVQVDRKHIDLHEIRKGGESLLCRVLKELADRDGFSLQGTDVGEIPQPFDHNALSQMMTRNPYHARCVHAKKAATVGVGFESPADKKRKEARRAGLPEPNTTPEEEVAAIDTLLDPMCDSSWQDLISDVCEDYWTTGCGYIEVRRRNQDPEGEIIGLHHLPARQVFVHIDNARYDRHYIVRGSTGVDRHFAKFGDLEGYFKRFSGADRALTSEVIQFRQPSALSRMYGFPDWLSAVPAIELASCLTQHEYDFFLNRGVPEFILFIIGQNLPKADTDKINTMMKGAIGIGNGFKSGFINLPGSPESIHVQLEKLAMESKSDGSQFSGMADSLSLQVVSAHGVPPLLAGIQIPGKLGATNELVQAMQAFQSLVIGPAQRIFAGVLRTTLANPARNGSLALTAKDLVLNTILDTMNLDRMDTVSRMRQSPQEAASEGRDLDKGVKG